jgi:hypothetical protein
MSVERWAGLSASVVRPESPALVEPVSLSLVPMNTRATVSGALLRVLGVLGLVAGVFAMHGLTAHHEIAMAGMHAPAAAQAATMSAAHMSASPPAGDAAGSVQAEVVSVAAVPQAMHQVAMPVALVDGFERVVVTPSGGRPGMVGACVAVLTGLLLLLALALGLRSLLAWRLVVLLAPVERLVLSERSPPWLAPSLSKLCVLRT